MIFFHFISVKLAHSFSLRILSPIHCQCILLKYTHRGREGARKGKQGDTLKDVDSFLPSLSTSICIPGKSEIHI